MMQDLIAGTVQVTIATPPSIFGFVNAGRVRPLAVAAKTRHPLMPDVPTTAEAGYPNFELDATVKADLKYWSAVIRGAGITAD